MSLIAAAVVYGVAAMRPEPLLAGAFNQPEGRGLAIVDVTFAEGTRYFDGLGRMTTGNRFRRADASAYLEYGVTDWLMAVVRPDLTAVSLSGTPKSHYTGLGTSDIGAQLQVLAFGPAVVAVQGLVRLPGSTDTKVRALAGNTSRDADLRVLFGLPFTVGDWPAFVDAQASYRLRSSHAPDEIHTDLTFGMRPWSDLLFLIQAFNTTALGHGTDWFPKADYTHVQVAAVYDFDASWSVELGVYTTVLGRRSLREQGVTTAVWYRF